MFGGPYASVLDVGGNVGDFAKAAYLAWPGARITSFEPLADVAGYNRQRAEGRWNVITTAIGRYHDRAVMHRNLGMASCSTMLEPGTARYDQLGIEDEWQDGTVLVQPLDEYLDCVERPCLLKIDVEGYELAVLRGADAVLPHVDTVVIEVQNDPDIFVDAPTVYDLSVVLGFHDLHLKCVAGAYVHPDTERVMQWDGVWTR